MDRWNSRLSVMVSALAVVLMCSAGSSLQAQGLPMPMGGPFDVGPLSVTPSVEAGYQRIGINFSMPANLIPGSLLLGVPLVGTSNVDFKLSDADVWVGAARLEVATTYPFFVFLGGEASATRNVTAVTTEFPGLENVGLFIPVQWNARQLQ